MKATDRFLLELANAEAFGAKAGVADAEYMLQRCIDQDGPPDWHLWADAADNRAECRRRLRIAEAAIKEITQEVPRG